MEQELLKIAATLLNASRDVDDTYSDLVKYPGYTKQMAAQRLLLLSKNLEIIQKRIKKLANKENK